MIDGVRKKILQKQGYKVVGNHSAIKICLWCKKAVRGEDFCYKHTFYGIRSWRCIQASVSVDVCNQKCVWCWRDIDTNGLKYDVVDEPSEILDGFVREQRKALEGYHGYGGVDVEKLKETTEPKHVALSLTGETCMYPKLPEMIEEIRRRGMTSFVVTNGTVPSMVKKLVQVKPTQFYITLPAPNEKTYTEVCNPLIEDGWGRIMKSLEMLDRFERGTVRLTLVKGLNMIDADDYVRVLKNVDFKFLELKAAMPVGYARYRMDYKQMPTHAEIRKFSEKVAKKGGFKIIDEKENSRVVLLMREDFDGRIMKFMD
ncbi:MAG: 4-demethylwyosine synthase TYW1 [Nanoarchaeota archaeon]|nr:4-demethylwyosine synthase TYW1 [Nanoarchaeota archaeon]